MERKRKLPARAARSSEPASKKRTSTPPEPRTQALPTPPPAPVEETLPKSVVAGKPLPTLDEPQPENLSTKEFQTIPESGVLVESIHRSRAKWLSEGIFERYWTKPTAKNKKKEGGGAAELPNNPPKDSMTKLGTCVITVEPHVFEATMFAIKDPQPKQTAMPIPPPPMYRPIIQYGPPNGMMPPPPPPPVQQKPIPQPQPIQKTPSKPQDTPMTNSDSSAHASPNSAFRPSSSNGVPNGQASTTSGPHQIPPTQPANPPAATKSTDPVIQMLAERAATDPDLKALMRIVANGEASPEELKKFQTHIDELTRLQKSRQAASQPTQPQNQPPPPAPPATPTHVNGSDVVKQSPAPAPAPSPIVQATPPPPSPRSDPHYQPQPQALRSKGPLPPTKPDISGVVFEFHGGSGDRFLFPKFSILEYQPHGQVVASFLIVRKGSSSDSPAYDPQLDYYQPITIRLWAQQGRQLDALQKVVAPADEVRRYMDDIMDNMTRAEYVLLAMRLPRDGDQAPVEKESEAEKPAQLDNQVLWATTNPTPAPQPVKSVPRLLTEEEKYQSFITTVS